MLKRLNQLFTPQDLKDRETLSLYQVLNSVVVISFLAVVGTITAVVAFAVHPEAFVMMVALAVLLLASFVLLRLRILLPAQIMAPLGLYASVTYIIAAGSGLHDIAIIAYTGILIVTGLTLGKRAVYGMTGLLTLTFFAFWWAETNGLLVTEASFLTTSEDPFLMSIILAAIAFVLTVSINRWELGVEQARKNEQVQIENNKELLELKETLEKRVEDRTLELEKINQQNIRRAAQFESIAQTARAMTSLQSLSLLLPRITELVSHQFGFYHTGIFLMDEKSEYAVLVAANSPGGARMMQKGHKLKVGQVGIVGYAAGSGNARIALDTGLDAVYFDNPDLPETRSEMALPLKSGGRVIGVLDVQSTEPTAFTNEDIASLTILADQISITIENTRQYEATIKSLEQTEATYRQYVHHEWARMTHEENLAGYRYFAGSSSRLDQPVDLGEVATHILDGKIYQKERETPDRAAELAIPVKLRGEVIGVLSISTPNKNQWGDDDIDIAEAVADRLALAIENARLFQVTTNRAERERVVSDIVSKISGNIRVESLLRTAAQELSQAISGSEVLIQLQTAKQLGGPQ